MTKNSSTVDLIAKSLRTDIMQGKLKSEQPLRQDEIAAQFGVSKIPVREALFQLKAEGLVTFFPNRGAAVSTLSPTEVNEIFIMRTALETAALKNAIPHLTVANLTQAEEILDAIDQEKRSPVRRVELGIPCHPVLSRQLAEPDGVGREFARQHRALLGDLSVRFGLPDSLTK